MPTDKNAPDTSSFAKTQGKPILCHGWVAREPQATWSPSNIHFDEIEIPTPGPHQVRVKLYAAGVNPADPARTAFPAPTEGNGVAGQAKPLHPAPQFPYPYVCGIDGAGVVESVGWGDDSTFSSLAVGDRVAFLADLQSRSGGTFAEYAVVDADLVAVIPNPSGPDDKVIDFPEAATLPAAPGTAYLCLLEKLKVERGKTIFISGASGGVGSAAVQIAKHSGLRVFGSCSTANMDYVKGLGADTVLDYTKANVVAEILKQTGGFGVDYLLETAPAELTEDHCNALCFGGSACVITGLVVPTTPMFFMRQLSIHYVFLGMLHRTQLRSELRRITVSLLHLCSEGALTVPLEEVPLSQAPDSLDRVSKCHTRGKIVLTSFHPDEHTKAKK